jgi:hypothetical protein
MEVKFHEVYISALDQFGKIYSVREFFVERIWQESGMAVEPF